jgi:hypothetical protein
VDALADVLHTFVMAFQPLTLDRITFEVTSLPGFMTKRIKLSFMDNLENVEVLLRQ